MLRTRGSSSSSPIVRRTSVSYPRAMYSYDTTDPPNCSRSREFRRWGLIGETHTVSVGIISGEFIELAPGEI